MSAQCEVALKRATRERRDVKSHMRGIDVAVPWEFSAPGAAIGNGELKQKACSDVQSQAAHRIRSSLGVRTGKIERMSRQKQLIKLVQYVHVPRGGSK